ncbi:MAG: aminotransferase class I/II-fold pyridoxal phosphate-dependent enzyme [Lysobacterales bacterium]
MDVDVPEEVRCALAKASEGSDFGYSTDQSWGWPLRVRTAFETWARARSGICVDPDDVVVLGQAMQGVCCSILAFTDPGDSIVVQDPVYGSIVQAVTRLGRRLVRIPVYDTGRLELEALSRRNLREVRAVILCNPHNPTGGILTQCEMLEIGRAAIERGWIIISDEVHQDFIYPPNEHISVCDGRNPARHLSVAITSAAKTFNFPGLKCAVAIFGSRPMRDRFGSLPSHLRSSACQFGMVATVAAWERCEAWHQRLLCWLQRNRDRAYEVLTASDMPFRLFKPQATYFLWIECLGETLGERASSVVRRRTGLWLQCGTTFSESRHGFVRLNFATNGRFLDMALERLVLAFR